MVSLNFSYLPPLGRSLIVATFLEDGFRILTQWEDQVYYMWNYRHIPYSITILFFIYNLIAMFSGSIMIIIRRKIEWATIALLSVVVTQALAYGLIFEWTFFLRNLSVIGGLVIVFSDSYVRDMRALNMPGLPMLEFKDNKKYFLLAGRVLIVFLFIGFSISKNWSFWRILVSIIGFIACAFIIIGYKAKFAALLLGSLLTIFDITVNHFWDYPYGNPTRDFFKYEFFQTLSIVGGLVLIINTGAGELSIDEKKKVY